MSDTEAQDSRRTAWLVMAVIVIVAVAALGVVYMNNSEPGAAPQGAAAQLEAAQRGMDEVADDSALAAQEVAERAERAAEESGEATGETPTGAVEAASDAVGDAGLR